MVTLMLHVLGSLPTIPDDLFVSNKRGYITFAQTNEPNSRSTQLFINVGNNKNLGIRCDLFRLEKLLMNLAKVVECL